VRAANSGTASTLKIRLEEDFERESTPPRQRRALSAAQLLQDHTTDGSSAPRAAKRHKPRTPRSTATTSRTVPAGWRPPSGSSVTKSHTAPRRTEGRSERSTALQRLTASLQFTQSRPCLAVIVYAVIDDALSPDSRFGDEGLELGVAGMRGFVPMRTTILAAVTLLLASAMAFSAPSARSARAVGCSQVNKMPMVFPSATMVGFVKRATVKGTPARAPIWPGWCGRKSGGRRIRLSNGSSVDVRVALFASAHDVEAALANRSTGRCGCSRMGRG
jgi:hypothetical protein